MPNKALQYAEEELGVNYVWQEVQDYLSSLDKTLSDLDKAQDRKRELEEKVLDAEVDLVNRKRGQHPNMSETGFKTNMKVWEREDTALMGWRIELNKITSEIQGLQYDADLFKLKIRAGSSRLEELGGYLHYLAAVKMQNQAEKTSRTNETRQQ